MLKHCAGIALMGLLGSGCAVDGVTTTADPSEADTTNNSLPNNSLPNNSMPNNSLANNSLPNNSLANNSLPNNSLPNNGLSDSTANAKFSTWLLADSFRPTLMKYLASCALPASKSASFTDSKGNKYSWPGMLGLAPNWTAGGQLGDPNDQERVSGCVLARVNNFGQPVEISLRGNSFAPGSKTTVAFPGLQTGTDAVTGKPETTAFPYWEGAVWGNLFLPTPEIHSCGGTNFGAAHGLGRECMNPTQGCDNWNPRNAGVSTAYPNAGLTYFKQNHAAHFCFATDGSGGAIKSSTNVNYGQVGTGLGGTAPAGKSGYPWGYPSAKGDCSQFVNANAAQAAGTISAMPLNGYVASCTDGTYASSNVITVYDRPETVVTRSVKTFGTGSAAYNGYYFSVVPQDAIAAGYTVLKEPYFWLQPGNVTNANVANYSFVFRCMPASGKQYLALSNTIANIANGASAACGSDEEEGQLGIIWNKKATTASAPGDTVPLYHWKSATKGDYYSIDVNHGDRATSTDWSASDVFGYVITSSGL